jgi:hypothetical protein
MRALALLVLSMAPVGQAQDSSDVLAKAREKLLRSIHNLPRYTCIETIDRAYFSQLKPRVLSMTEAPAPSCKEILPPTVDQLPLLSTDRLRLEVAVVNGAEVFAWPGASKFDTRYIGDVLDGPFGTGAFGNHLVDIFDNSGTRFVYSGESTVGGRRMLAYAFRVPKAASGFRVGRSRAVTGYGGSFELDPANFDLVQMVIETDKLPPETGMCLSTTRITYHPVRIGEGEFVLPLESQLRMSEPDNGDTNNRTTFSDCREYKAESTMRFDTNDTANANPEPVRGSTAAEVPPNIQLELELVSPIDIRSAAAGDRISAKISRTSDKKHAPAGAIVSGRIIVLRHWLDGLPTAQIAIAFDGIELNGVGTRLALRPARNKPQARSVPNGFQPRAVDLDLPPPDAASNGASFTFPAKKDFVLKPGFKSAWITIAP